MAAVAVLVLLTSCGGDERDDRPRRLAETAVGTGIGAGTGTGTGTGVGTSATTDEASAPVVSAYRDWLAALAAQDADAACGLQAPDYTIQLRSEAILAHRAELGDPCVGFEALVWEDPAFDSDITGVEVTQRTDEDALLAVELASGAQTVRMVYHRAGWRVFSTTDRAAGAAGPARWLAAWCGLSPDDTRADIVDAMGEPSGEYTVSNGGEPQLWWAQDQYDFRVYIDVDGSVLELVGDYDALSADDRAQLPCPELRS